MSDVQGGLLGGIQAGDEVAPGVKLPLIIKGASHEDASRQAPRSVGK